MGGFVSCIALNLCECAACMACSCCTSIFNATMAQAARFAHILVIVATFALAIILGQSYPNEINGYSSQYTSIDLSSGCSSEYLDECIYRQLIYRASFSLVLLFLLVGVLSSFSDYANKSFWILKFGLAISVFIGFWWSPNDFFSGWAEVARVVSFFWLLVQALLLFDFAHDLHDVIMKAADDEEQNGGDSRGWYGLYLFLALGFLTCVGVGLAYLFIDYVGCQTGMAFTVVTLIFGVITTCASVLSSINKGLLTPTIMFAYSVFMCWYALLSSPESSCNPSANVNNGVQNGALIAIVVVTVIVLLYCVINGTKILNVFNPEGEGVVLSSYSPGGAASVSSDMKTGLTGGTDVVTSAPTGKIERLAVDDNSSGAIESGQGLGLVGASPTPSSGTVHERVFFHLLLVLTSAYGAMILTSWGKTTGAPAAGAGSDAASNESMYLKIVSQWVFMLLYMKSLQVAYSDQTE